MKFITPSILCIFMVLLSLPLAFAIPGWLQELRQGPSWLGQYQNGPAWLNNFSNTGFVQVHNGIKCVFECVPRCGDGIINQVGEQCDDGNNVDGDGCSANCTIENEIPEFTTIGAGLVLAGAGYYMYRKRHRK